MKKNISINISGIIFHIEEDGYDVLKKYLDSINKYFSSFEDSSEILPDIESRIAEIFLGKLNEGKQVITLEDVQSLMTTMGSVRDFQAAEEQEAEPEAPKARTESRQSSSSSASDTQSPFSRPRVMARDQKRKVLGGVCAGLANYWNIDTVWVRLLFALFTFLYAFGLFAYIILWIAMPGSYDMEEIPVKRKLYRDTDKKVLGGVAGGLSAYFGIDLVAVRVLLVISAFFGGAGVIGYIVLWIVLPEARSITDKMQMQGEPVTLSNIETNIKKNQDGKLEKEESAIVKILLFPFRLIGFILTGLGKILVPILDLVRIAIGVFIALVGFTFILSVVVTGGVLIGLFTFSPDWALSMENVSLPMDALSQAIPPFTGFMGFLGALIPGIFITLLGISIVAKRIVFGAAVGWSLFIIFFISAMVLSISIPRIIYNFKEEGEYKVEQVFDLKGKTAVLQIRETGMDDYHVASLALKPYDGKEFKLVQYFEAQGVTRQQAAENAQMVVYNVEQKDSVLTFDSNIQFKKDAVFRAQRLRMTLYIPKGNEFLIGDDVYRLLTHYMDYEDRENNTWVYTPEGELECLTCPKQVVSTPDGANVTDEYNLRDFRELTINGLFDVHIYRGDEYAVELVGDADEKEKYSVYTRGDELIIEYKNDRRFVWKKDLAFDKMKINIVMPALSKLEINGAGDLTIDDFDEEDLDIEANGAIEIDAYLNARNLTIDLNGASKMELEGSGTTLEANLAGASILRAFNYETRDAIVETVAVCRAYVNVTGHLDMRKGFGSKIEYKGNPEVITED
jgi:phage shock protein PspC (stress-responsive transcriptional regulator)